MHELRKTVKTFVPLIGIMALTACTASDVNEGSALGQKQLNTALEVCGTTLKDGQGHVPRDRISQYLDCRSKAFQAYVDAAYGVYAPIHESAEAEDAISAKRYESGQITREDAMAEMTHHRADMYSLLAARLDQVETYKAHRAQERAQAWRNFARGLNRASDSLNSASSQVPQSTTMLPQPPSILPTNYSIQRWQNGETVTGTDGSYVTCSNFSAGAQCTRLR